MMGWQEQLQTILLVLGGLLLLIDPAAGQMEFLNPPPSKRASDFNSDLIYQMGEVVNVAWTPGREGKLTSLALWQLNATTTQYYGDFEYITQKASGITRLSWIVATAKNLTESNLFFLSIFEDGRSEGDSITRSFNITRGPSEDQDDDHDEQYQTTSGTIQPNPTSTPPSPDTTASPTDMPSRTDATNDAVESNSSPETEDDSGSLSIGALVGIGVSVPLAVILVAAAGWIFIKRRRAGQGSGPVQTDMHFPPTDYGHRTPCGNMSRRPQWSGDPLPSYRFERAEIRAYPWESNKNYHELDAHVHRR